MTEREKLQRAKMYIDYLARGFNPLTEEPVKNDDTIRNERISRCLMYVSDVLGEVLEKGIKEEREFSYQKQTKIKKKDFTITDKEKSGFVFSDRALTVTEIANGLSSLVDGESIKPLKGVAINEWLMNNGFLTEVTGYNNKILKSVTAEGKEIGIIEVERISEKGFPYKTILHTRSSQKFIIDNLDAVIEYNSISKEVKRVKKEERKLIKQLGKCDFILDEVINDLYAAGLTSQEIADSTDMDVRTISDRMNVLGLK